MKDDGAVKPETLPKLQKGEVFVICYGKGKVYKRNQAKKFFKEAMLACEGSERDRYMNIWAGLDEFPRMNCFEDDGTAWRI